MRKRRNLAILIFATILCSNATPNLFNKELDAKQFDAAAR